MAGTFARFSTAKRNPHAVKALIDAVNAEDLVAVEALLHDDFEFIDAHGRKIRSAEHGLEMLTRLFAAGVEYRLKVDSITFKGEHFLLKGQGKAADASLCKPLLWQVRTKGRKVIQWQTFGENIDRTLLDVLVPSLIVTDRTA